MEGLQILQTSLENKKEQEDFLTILNSYAIDVMGGGKPLDSYVLDNLIPELISVKHKLILLAYLDGKAVGLANCFYGFSSFKAKKLINLHDFAVLEEVRGKGVGRAMLQELAKIATEEGCCKITLEVLEGNKRALGLYESEGFSGYELDPEMGKAIFLDKIV